MMMLRCKGASHQHLHVGFFLLICIMVSYLVIPYISPQLKSFSETTRYSDVARPRHAAFTEHAAFVEHANTEEPNAGHTRYGEAEEIYRQVESNIYYNKQYSLALLRQFNTQISGQTEQEKLKEAIEDVKHYFRVTQYDLWRFGNESGLHAWQKKEMEALGDLIQHRIHALQNPADCKSAKKIICNIPVAIKARGTGSQLHHISYCFLAAYGTQRTLIIKRKETKSMVIDMDPYFLPLSESCTQTTQTIAKWPGTEDSPVVQFPDTDRPFPRPNYLPRSVPRDIAQRLTKVHGDPFAWWMGQFFKYTMRMTRGFQKYVEKLGDRLGFKGPIVGVQVRRTDKLRHDSRLIGLEEYMEAVDDFFDDLELRGTKVTTRRIYLATDDPQVLMEAKKFPNHTFVYNEESIATASLSQRRTEANVKNFMADIYFLSRSDFLVCAMSSNICRLAYELMQTLHQDASRKVFSVDSPYWFHFQSDHEVEARYPHTPRREEEIELQKGDRVREILRYYSKHRNYHDGFIHGFNQRTRKAGLYPIYKTVDVLRLADTPPFDAIDMRDK
ncbi:alpha-(1,6)-fucosyltransferase-like [Penaeus indicus]|uniref:alpha-(1,6)-fucosyltransferase-like n=1 Tax=Penaeus indicus TaxID=29960 RepID=UPI00300CAF9B